MPRYTNIKPPFPSRVDWAHPLARNLEHCILLNEGAGDPINLVTLERGTRTGSLEWLGKRGMESDGSTDNRLEWTQNTLSRSSLTVFIHYYDPNAAQQEASSYRSPLTYFLGKGGVNRNHDNSSFVGVVWCKDSSSFHTIDLNDDAAGEKKQAYTYDGATLKGYKNGQFHAQNTGPSGDLDDPGNAWLFQESAGNDEWTGRIYVVLGWSRVLLDKEILSISNEPYQFILSNVRRQFWFYIPEEVYEAVVEEEPEESSSSSSSESSSSSSSSSESSSSSSESSSSSSSSSSESSSSSSSSSSESSSSSSESSSSSSESSSSSSEPGALGEVTWGHDTGVTETNIRDFSGNWSGTGSISGSGDAEQIDLSAGENMESEDWNLGAGDCAIQREKYGSGSGSITIKYKTAATQGALGGLGWTVYSGSFTSLGWVKIRIEAA